MSHARNAFWVKVSTLPNEGNVLNCPHKYNIIQVYIILYYMFDVIIMG